ncbi:MAG TPA: TonB-dependent receptor [Puia sp.]|nr:TonB-dependent receptor [Puia sp.]
MRNYKALSLFGLLCWFSSQAFGQQIKGEVTDKITHSPVAGASIIITGTKGVTSNAEGKFTFEANGAKSFVVSSVGYKAKTIPITDAASYSVELEGSNQALDQVVVVGYGTQKKADLTGAVATVDINKTFASKPMNDPTKALQGIVPGLTILYGNGGLTAGADIKIRGIGSINGQSRPLILVDNVQTDDLSIINPQDIESISVLKDAASASIYGARAAFGVILIKTKTGKKNQKSTISYTNNFSTNTPTILPDFAEPVDELHALNAAGIRGGTASPETFGMDMDTLAAGIANWEKLYKGKNTGLEMIKGEDWDVRPSGRTYFYKVWDPKKEFLNKYTFSQNHNIAISGGSEKMSYYLSGGYSYDGGMFKMNPDAVKKYNVTAGLNASVTNWLDVSAKVMYRNYQYDYPHAYQDYWYYFWRWGAYFPYGTYQGKYFRVNSAYMDAASKDGLSDNYSRIDLGATVKITRDLNFRVDYTIGRDNSLRHESGGPVTGWDFWTAGALSLTNLATAASDAVTYTSGRAIVNTFNGYLTYQHTFATDHHLKAIAGINSESNENINFFASRAGLLDPSQAELGLTYGAQTSGPTGSSVPLGWDPNGHGHKAFAGYFGRVNYAFQDKFLLELNGRYDGSSYFSPEDRWAWFSSGSAGYRISQEKFFEPLKRTISDMKIRASYGELGNQDVTTNGLSPYQAIMTGSQATWLTSAGTYAQTIGQPQSIAKSLKWERIRTLDFGLDTRILNDHIGVTFDWYQRDNDGMIQPTSVPLSFGTGGPKINAGNFRTRGYEISIDANYSLSKDLNIYGSIGFSDDKTVFTKWSNPSKSISNAAGINYQGKTYGEIWGFQTDRFFTDATDAGKISQVALQNGSFVYGAGDIKFKDLNKDGKIDGGSVTLGDHGDLKVIGNSQPRYQYNARVGATWKGFDIDIFIQGVGKRDWWGVGQTVSPLWQSIDILYANQMDFWTPTNTKAFYPNPYPGNTTGKVPGLSAGGNNFYPQSKYLMNLAYTRLKNVTIGYAINSKLFARYGITKLRFYVSGENIAEIRHTNVPLDPEITDASSTSGFTGRVYPFMRTYSGGLQLSF